MSDQGDTITDANAEMKSDSFSGNDPRQDIDRQIQDILSQLQEKRRMPVYPLFIGDLPIDPNTVDGVFDDLRSFLPSNNEKLDVIVHSPGGDIHAAYNLALLFRRFARKQLNFIVPRWAKSAATLLVCGGNKI